MLSLPWHFFLHPLRCQQRPNQNQNTFQNNTHMLQHLLYVQLLVLLLSSSTTQHDLHDPEVESESGTKWMLDQCATSFMIARIRAYRILLQMEDLSDHTFDQRMLFYGSTNNDRENAEFYLAVARAIDNRNVMESISLELERLELIGVWKTRRQDEEVNILKEFQRHLIPLNVDQQQREQYSNRRKRKARLPEGRIPALDKLVKEYMRFRADADLSVRQVSALILMMAEGLPKRWAEKYAKVMKAIETKGVDHLHVLRVEWSKKAHIQAQRLAQKVAATGKEQYSIGGEEDPDGRMLVIEAFESVSEWTEYRNEKGVGGDDGHESNDGGGGLGGNSNGGSGGKDGGQDGVPVHLPTRKPKPKVEIAQDIRKLYLDWPSWEDNGPWRILVFSVGGGFIAGGLLVVGRWCQDCATRKKKKRMILLPPKPGSPVKRVKFL